MREVALEAGLSQPFLSQIERGQAQPSMRSLDRIAHALGASAVSLLSHRRSGGQADIVRVADRVGLLQDELDPGSRAAALTPANRQLRVIEFSGGWREFQAYSPAERAAVLDRAADLLEARAAEVAELIIAEMGSPMSFVEAGQVPVPISFLSAAAEMARTYPFEEYRGGPGGRSLVLAEPVGVVASIVPSNLPLYAVDALVVGDPSDRATAVGQLLRVRPRGVPPLPGIHRHRHPHHCLPNPTAVGVVAVVTSLRCHMGATAGSCRGIVTVQTRNPSLSLGTHQGRRPFGRYVHYAPVPGSGASELAAAVGAGVGVGGVSARRTRMTAEASSRPSPRSCATW